MHSRPGLVTISVLVALILNILLPSTTLPAIAQLVPQESSGTTNISTTDTTPIADVVKISSGYEHTCAIVSGGAVQCWGRNQSGQLGDGTTDNKLSPVNVTNLFNATDIAAGQFHTCAVTSNGGVKCWGSHAGLTSTGSTLIPVDAPGLTSGVKSVVAGSRFTCVLTTGGGVKCWGVNNYGQLGDGGTTTQSAPVDVSGLTNGVSAISLSNSHVCALMQDGTVKCWGYGGYGALGNGSNAHSSVPVNVLDLSNMISISAGASHTCAVTSTGAVKCWGYGGSGQLGNGRTSSSSTPQDVSGLINGTKEVAAGGSHTCAVMTGGNVKCWGSNNVGQIGDDTVTSQNSPVDIPISSINHLSLGNQHSCALTDRGTVRCWGNNSYGQVGNGTSGQSLVPVPGIPSAGTIQMMDTYANHGCAVNANGGAICWGENTYGQIGDGTTSRIRIAPVSVVGLTNGIKMVAAGGQHSCALTTGGAVKCWGRNNRGQLGDGTVTDSPLPLDVIGLSSGVETITAGNDHTCALMESGGAKCWGNNNYGKLGDGTSTFRAEPFDVVGLSSGATKVSAGADHTCAVMSNGTAKCWGYNGHSGAYGRLGNGTTDSSLTPVDVSELSDIVDIGAGDLHTCALTSTNGIKCWGDASNGRLGNAGGDSLVPVAVVGSSSDAAFLVVGKSHSCTVTLAGGVKCWGYNNSGQLGNDTTNSASSPVRVTGLNSGISKVLAGGNHTCALLQAGSVQCWGSNGLAQFGNSGGATIPLPVDVIGQDYGVQGQVLNAGGQPQAGVRVQVIGGQAVHTDSSGAYQFDALSPGIITIWPQKDGYIFSPSSRTVRIPQETAGVNFTATAVVTEQPPEVQTKPPLLVVHGIQVLSPSGFNCDEKVVPYRGAYHTTLADLPEWFKDTHQVWIARYNTSALHTPSISENANCLREQVDDVYRAANRNGGDQKITIIAHSMGGLVTRACLAYSDCRRKVGAVYTLGSPHAGLNSALVSKILLQLAENALLAHGIPVPLDEGVCMWQPALCEMSAEEMLIFNLDPGHKNQAGIDYVFIGGEATPRSASSFWNSLSSVGTGITLVTDGYNDGVVGRDSAVGWATISGFFPSETGAWTANSPPLRYWTDEVHFPNLSGGSAYHQNRDGYGRSYSYDCIAYHMGIGQGSQPTVCKTATTSVVSAAGAEPQLTEATESIDGVLNLGETITHTLQIDTGGASTFALAWSSGNVRFELLSPGGQRFSPENNGAATYAMSPGSDGFPSLTTYQFTATESGTWKLILDANSLNAPATGYIAFAAFESDRQFTVNQNKAAYNIGETALFTATLAANDVGVAGASVTAELDLPDGTMMPLVFTDAGDGVYLASYTVPNVSGRVAMSTRATGNDGGTDFTRQVEGVWTITPQSAGFTGSVTDQAIDDNNDGEFDSLTVNVEINVTIPSTFSVSAELRQGDTVIDTTADRVVASAPGRYVASLEFDGLDIGAIGANGTFSVTNAVLKDIALGDLFIATVENLHTTKSYNTPDFESSAPDAPTLLSPEDNITIEEGTSLTYQWQPVANATSYTIRQVLNPDTAPTEVHNTTVTAPTYMDAVGLNPGRYRWEVKAISAENVESQVSSRSFAVAPHNPSNVQASTTSCQAVTLTWKDNSAHETAYYIYRNNEKIGESSSLTGGSGEYKDTGLAESTTYEYKVIAYHEAATLAGVISSVATPACDPNQIMLTMNKVGNGTVTADPPGPYASGTQVQLTATPAAGWRFDHWESTAALGDQATQPIITITVTETATYTAHFAENPSTNMLYLPIITR